MIKGINTSGRYIEVTGGSSPTYVNKSYSSSAHNQGQMMYDLEAQCIKVFDGSSWIVLHGSFAAINLTYEAESLLQWTQQKREEERLREKLIEEHPHLKEAHEALKNEQEKFELLVTLSTKHKQSDTSESI